MEDKKVWGIHTMDDHLFLKKNTIAIGWPEMGDLTIIDSNREAFKKKYSETYPDSKKGAIPTSSGMLYRFIYEIQVGDYIIYPSKLDKMVNIGQVTGKYIFDPSQQEYVQQRTVKWLKHVPRTSFSQGALHEIGSAMSLFLVKKYSDEFLSALDKNFHKNLINSDEEDDSVGATSEEIKQSTKDFILKELSKHLKGYDFEGFIANLLEAMGYRAIISPQGGDSGIDIIAYKDELPPRILVQVKSQDSQIKETTIQSLKGAMHEGDYGLFVTLSSYTKNAQNYLKHTPIIKGIDGTELVELILKHYESLDKKYKRIIPLEMVYIPVPYSDD